MITSVPKEVEVLTEEREKIGVRIREADRVAAEAEEGESREGMKRRATQLRTIYFRIEDVIDEWNSCLLHERWGIIMNFSFIYYISLFFLYLFLFEKCSLLLASCYYTNLHE